MTTITPRAIEAPATFVGLTREEITDVVMAWGHAPYRGKQISEWIYRQFAQSADDMSNLPADLRRSITEMGPLNLAKVAHQDSAPDGTVKYLLRLNDGETVEAVYLPYSERVSICLSSQVGCPAGCTFCATAKGGLARNMTAGEIVEQIRVVQVANPERRISHAVFMGMGEPLLNYPSVVGALRLMTQEMGMSARRITVSTVGVVPGILALAKEAVPVTLALSLHAPDDETRARLIPTARKWPIAEILGACRHYFDETGRNLTFEYLMIANVNDDPEQATQLGNLLAGLPGNVNLIPFNYVETHGGFRRPTIDRVRAFREALEATGRNVTQRMERGHAISAACGQLRRTEGTLRTKLSGIPLGLVGNSI